MNEIEENNFEINQNDFVEQVIEESTTKLVLVDFWAPWCEPCKQLGPTLEKIAKKYSDVLKLVKINIDDNQQMASQLQIQSIPTVMAFYNKKIANAFQGVLPESQIISFLKKILGDKLNSDDEIILEIKNLLKEKKFEDAKNKLEQIIVEKNNPEFIALLIRSYVELKEIDKAKELIDSVDEETQKNKLILTEINNFELINKAKGHDNIDEIELLLKEEPEDYELNIKFAEILYANNRYGEAFNLLINLYKKSKTKNKEKIKKNLIKYFNALGNNHEETKNARRKLSSIIFS